MLKIAAIGVSLLFPAVVQAASYTVPLLVNVEPHANVGFFEDGATGTFYLSVSSEPFPFVTFTPENSVSIGTYTVTQSLTISPLSFSLGIIESKLTDGVDEYLRIYLRSADGSFLIGSSQLRESSLLGRPAGTDLQGMSVVGASFRLDEIRSRLVSQPPAPNSLQLYYIDASVTLQAVPEPATAAALAGLGAFALTATRRRR